jgi:hypothetical protein
MKSRIAIIVFASIFMISFGGVGFWALSKMGQMLLQWQKANSYVPVDANIVDAELKVKRDSDSTTYRVQARYEYEFQGKRYSSSRVGIADGSDNFDRYQRDMANRLQRAKQNGATVRAWVDPNRPELALLDREMRWKQFVFMIPFGLVFTLVGVGAAYFVVRAIIGPGQKVLDLERRYAKDKSEWWRANKDWIDGHVKSSARAGMFGIGFFALFWNGVSLPIYFGALLPSQDTPLWAKVVFALFPIIGIALLWLVVKVAIQTLRYGETVLKMEPFPARLGEAVNVSMVARNTRAIGKAFDVKLICNYVDSSGSGTSRSEKWSTALRVVATTANSDAAHVQIRARIAIPADLPPSESPSKTYRHEWQVEIVSHEARFTETFVVPVIAET